MATTLVSNLYPPIMDTYMPTFDKEAGCKVYFTLSNYNGRNDINNYAQVSVKYQHSNQTALKKSIYPLELAFKSIYQDDKGYYVYITKNDLEKNEFCTNNYYKIQIRFMSPKISMAGVSVNSSTYIVNVPESMKKVAWINTNLEYFSEWSKICLIKGIEKPIFNFTYLDADYSKEVILTDSSFTQIIGDMSFSSIEEKEYLKTYDIKVYTQKDITENTSPQGIINWENIPLVYESGEIYPIETNSRAINHNILYMFDNHCHYVIYFHYITNNDYEETFIMRFYTSNIYDNQIPTDFRCELEEADARIKLELDIDDDYFNIMNPIFNDSQARPGGIVFRRSSNKSDFKYWEDIRIIDSNDLIRFKKGGVKTYKCYDYTIESGVFYQYAVQAFNGKGQRTPLKIFGNNGKAGIWMCDMEDMFLTDKNKQLKISLNPQVSSYSHVLMEGKTETIGSKYPFFYRNGIVNYKTFNISGLISQAMDENYVFFNKEDFDMTNHQEIDYNEDGTPKTDSVGHILYKSSDLNRKTLYGDYYDFYKQYNKNMKIQNDRDYIFERMFREEVMAFLYDGKAKLFRSATEGNVLVRLMNISFTPEQQLGRLVYTFNATAYELDECNFNNYVAYNIHEIKNTNNTYDKYSLLDTSLIRIGELDFTINEDNFSLRALLSNRYNRNKIPYYDSNGTHIADYDYSLKSIDWVRIYFQGTNGPIGHGGVEQTVLIKNTDGYLRVLEEGEEVTDDVFLGFLIQVNGLQVVVSRLGVYTIEDKKVPINDITFSDMIGQDINVRIEYRVTLNRTYAESTEEKLTRYYFTLGTGQIWTEVSTTQDIIELIKNKYEQETETIKQDITNIRRLIIESEPNVIIAVNRAGNDETITYLNKSGQLEIEYGTDSIVNARLLGYKLIKNKSYTPPLNLHPGEYYLVRGEFKQENIKEIKPNRVYNVGDKHIIYFRNNWYEFDLENETVLKPVNLMINYVYELRRGSL